MTEPREWFIDVNEWLDERERCQGGMAFTQGWLDEMEMSPHKMIPVIERSAYDQLLKDARELVGLLKSINVQQIVNGKAGQELRATEISEAITAFEKKWGGE